jgi:hypothetical protein
MAQDEWGVGARREATVEPGRTTWLDLADRGPIRVEGRVIDAQGAVPGAEVHFDEIGSTRTDATGKFALGAWFFRTAHLAVRVDGMHWSYDCSGTPTGGGWSAEIRLGDHTLDLVTRDVAGQPVAAKVQISEDERCRLRWPCPRGHTAPSQDEVQVEADLSADLRTGSDGRLRLRHLHPGSYVVKAVFADGSEQRAKVRVPEQESVTIRAATSGTIDVMVRDAQGRVVPRVLVSADARGWSRRTAPTDRDGVVRFTGLPPGTFTVSCYRLPGGVSDRGVAHPRSRRTLLLQPGTTERVELIY